MTINQGQICLTPGTKKNIKALIQWCRETVIVDNNPVTMPFANNQQLIRMCRYKAHQQFKDKSKEISAVVKPEKLQRTPNGLIGLLP